MQVNSSKSPWFALVITSLAGFAVSLDTIVVVYAFPQMTRDFASAGATDISWVLNAYTIVFAALLVPSGRMADLIGRKRVFLTGTAIFTSASALCGVAPSADALIAFRVAQAFGGALLASTGLALTLAAFPKERRILAVTIATAAAASAFALGPIAGSTIVTYWGWRWIFYLNVPVGLLTLALGLWALSESRDPASGRRPDIPGTLLLIAATALVAYGIVESSAYGWTSERIVASIALGFATMGAVILRTLRSRAPVVDPKLFAAPRFLYGNLGVFFVGTALAASALNGVYFLTVVWHYPLVRAAYVFTPAALEVTVLAPVMGRLAKRHGFRVLSIPGGLILASSAALLELRATPTPDLYGLYLPAVLLTGLGLALCLPVLTSAIMVDLPFSDLAVGGGIANAFRQFGSVVGAALAISFLTGATSPLVPFRENWTLIAVCGVCTSVIALGLRPRSRAGPVPRGERTPTAVPE